MWFDPYAFAEKPGSEGSPGANHANRANPHPSISTSSTISTGGPAEPAAAISTISIVPGVSEEITDPDALLALLRDRGPMTYGAAASALGGGATRGWRVKTELRQGGRIRLGPFGRAFIIEQTERP